jgi:hypothetical protein
VELNEVWRSLRSSNYWWLLPAFGGLVVFVVLRSIRWRYLFVAQTRPSLWPVTEATLIGQFFNSVLPARAGELARVVALNLRAGTSRAETLSTVVVERAFDVLALLVLLFVGLPWFPDVTWLRTAAWLAVGLGLALALTAVALALYGERPVHFLLRPLARLPFLSTRRVELAALNLTQGLAGLRRTHLGLGAFALTTASWLVLAVTYWLVLLCFDLGLSPGAALLVVIATGLSLVLPSGPAALGVFEAATVVALGAYGVSESKALSYALVLHALIVVPFIAAGGVVLNLHGAELGRWAGLLVAGDRPRVNEDHVPEPADR